jgi:hypothetical protein
MVSLLAYLDGVRNVTVRDVAGEGCQTELLIQTKRGAVALRLCSTSAIRITDLRHRDRGKRRRARLVDVPIAAVR